MQSDLGGLAHQFSSILPPLKLSALSTDQRERVFTSASHFGRGCIKFLTIMPLVVLLIVKSMLGEPLQNYQKFPINLSLYASAEDFANENIKDVG